LRWNPWRRTDRIDTIIGSMYKPDPYKGDFVMVFPPEVGHRGRYYPILLAQCPGNLESLYHHEISCLTDLYTAGYRRIPFDQVPVAWQQAFRADIANAS
jgi:hypothetical protein